MGDDPVGDLLERGVLVRAVAFEKAVELDVSGLTGGRALVELQLLKAGVEAGDRLLRTKD